MRFSCEYNSTTCKIVFPNTMRYFGMTTLSISTKESSWKLLEVRVSAKISDLDNAQGRGTDPCFCVRVADNTVCVAVWTTSTSSRYVPLKLGERLVWFGAAPTQVTGTEVFCTSSGGSELRRSSDESRTLEGSFLGKDPRVLSTGWLSHSWFQVVLF